MKIEAMNPRPARPAPPATCSSPSGRPAPLPATKVNAPPPPPPKTAGAAGRGVRRAPSLAQFRPIGTALRGGRAQGFLMKGEQSFMVTAGDRAGDRFTVESVSAGGVVLKRSAHRGERADCGVGEMNFSPRRRGVNGNIWVRLEWHLTQRPTRR
ncbi:MAG: hypothetical protein M0C28_17780 [Candidatus Moduliflexus flocculans]|nr:hypothetical protein [Candidatus Moduliflexus flocculans]